MMIRVFTLILILSFILNSVKGQSGFFQFEQINFTKIDSIEFLQGSIEKFIEYKISINSKFFPDSKKYNLAQPRIFDRPQEKDFISCQVQYFFSIEDSTVRLITYTWDTKNSATSLSDLLNPQNDQSNNLKDYNIEFDIISGILIKQLGRPIDEFVQMDGLDNSTIYKKKVIWKKGNTSVELIMIWKDAGGRLGTYQIRTKIYW